MSSGNPNRDDRLKHLSFVVVTFGILIALIGTIKGWQEGIVPIIALTIVLVIVAPLFRPAPGRFGLCILVFAAFAGTVAFTISQNSLWAYGADIVTYYTRRTSPDFPIPKTDAVGQFILIAVTFVAYIWTVLLTRDTTAMSVHPEHPQGILGQKEYGDRLESFCRSLERNLNDIDTDSRWSNEFFVPVEAEVEIKGRKGYSKRRIVPLIKALKGYHHLRFFLLLGDPGSGKSVALRKLARDLLGEVKTTKRVPIYLNLRDWRTPPEWSATNMPTATQVEKDLRDWIHRDLKDRLDQYAFQFLETYFEEMERQGRFFYLLDSFDEIAILLDVDESHALIDVFSEAIARLLDGAHHSRGVLSSRLFRKPTARLGAPGVFEIRPLSNTRILDLAQKRITDPDALRKILSERPDLAQAARNPFTAVLLVEFIRAQRRGTGLNSSTPRIPTNRGEIYQNHLTERLPYCRNQLNALDLTEDQFLTALERIATSMFQGKASFEINASQLSKLIEGTDNQDFIRVLTRARLIRASPADDARISFSHRRFAEYLSARGLLSGEIPLPVNDIPTDSLWRDTLVLYCEIAPEEEARMVANYCWQVIDEALSKMRETPQDPISGEQQKDRQLLSQWLPALHCIRFITDAYRSRLDLLNEFQTKMGAALNDIVTNQENPLVSKFAIEACGVLNENDTKEVLISAIKRNNLFISETALKACRYSINSEDRALSKSLCEAIQHLPTFEFVRTFRDYHYEFSINRHLSIPKTYAALLFLQYVLFSSAIIASTLSFLITIASATGRDQNAVLNDIAIPAFTILALSVKLSDHTFLSDQKVTHHFLVGFLITSPYADFVRQYIHNESLSQKIPATFALGFFIFNPTFLTFETFFRDKGGPRFSCLSLLKVVKSEVKGYIPVAAFLPLLSIPYFVITGLDSDVSWIRIICQAISFLFLSLCSLVTIVGVIFLAIIPILKDFLYLHQINRPQEPFSRSWISEVYLRLESQKGKQSFVKSLRRISVTDEDWSSVPPYNDDSRASVELARLDERWRGLDR